MPPTETTYPIAAEEIQQELERSRHETILRLQRVVELRDEEAPGHVERVSRYCGLVAKELGLSEQSVELIALGSTLHDAGKVALPEAILLKEGKLTPHERKVMQQHTVVGHRLLAGSESPLLQVAAEIAWTHHERFDGSGYPRFLSGEYIPLEGRIAAVADVFDALVTDRPYRAAFTLDKAMEVMESERGNHFDPRVLDAFLSAREEVVAIMQTRHAGSLFGNGADPSRNGS
jgi:putative two-component system response regulator